MCCVDVPGIAEQKKSTYQVSLTLFGGLCSTARTQLLYLDPICVHMTASWMGIRMLLPIPYRFSRGASPGLHQGSGMTQPRAKTIARSDTGSLVVVCKVHQMVISDSGTTAVIINLLWYEYDPAAVGAILIPTMSCVCDTIARHRNGDSDVEPNRTILHPSCMGTWAQIRDE